jgi:hypothetical protein
MSDRRRGGVCLLCFLGALLFNYVVFAGVLGFKVLGVIEG